jgi:hypothetical protein
MKSIKLEYLIQFIELNAIQISYAIISAHFNITLLLNYF